MSVRKTVTPHFVFLNLVTRMGVLFERRMQTKLELQDFPTIITKPWDIENLSGRYPLTCAECGHDEGPFSALLSPPRPSAFHAPPPARPLGVPVSPEAVKASSADAMSNALSQCRELHQQHQHQQQEQKKQQQEPHHHRHRQQQRLHQNYRGRSFRALQKPT